MTEQDAHAFMVCFNQLVVALPMPSSQSSDPNTLRAKQQVYFEALSDLPISAVQAAMRGIVKRGAGFFPSTQEWYQQADQIAHDALLSSRPALPAAGDTESFDRAKAARGRFLEQLRARPVSRTGVDFVVVADVFERAIPVRDPARDQYAPWCQDCQDSTWMSQVCRHGDRCEAHDNVDEQWGEHEHVVRCSCVPMNPQIQRRRDLARRRA